MRLRGLLLAGAVVLVTSAYVLFQAARNRAGTPLATIELTERELRLLRPVRESTALFFEIVWEPRWGRFKFEDGPGWFDTAKLKEVGFDCSLPVTDPRARSFYRSVADREAFAVLEYNEAAHPPTGETNTATWSRLTAVDAGLDASVLRRKYPDGRRYLVVPAVVKLMFAEKWDMNARSFQPGGYLRGVVSQLAVSAISIPPSQRQVFDAVQPATSEYFVSPEGLARGPRYAVVLNYGLNYEPWIESCRLLGAPAAAR